MSFELIDNDSALRELCTGWAGRQWLAVDTEFVRVDTYQARLCLVQLGDGQRHACVDVLACTDLSPLWKLLHRPSLIKVLHSASQDYEIFVQLTGRCPAPLFDTQTAATLLGIGDQIGYAGLIEKRLGIVVDKSLSRTDWARRPLSTAELDYAAGDVAHLAAIYPALQEELAAAGRLGWLAQDCARACDPAAYATLPADAWRRLKGLARLNAAQQTAAAALAAWRESEAAARNRPRKWIIEDEAIYRLAERQPADLPALERLQVLPPKTLSKHSEALLKVLADCRQQPARTLALDEDLTPAQRMRLAAVQAAVRETAEQLKLPPGYLAPKADLLALVLQGAQARIPLLAGWRREVLGEKLLTSAL